MDINKKAPAFCLEDDNHEKKCLKSFFNQWVVLYFYPKDNTSGCTREAIDFTLNLSKFRKLGAEIIGVSPDSVESHIRFKEKQKLKLLLLSDPTHKVKEQ